MPNPLKSFDISWVNPDRAEYYLADRSNSSIDVIDTQHLTLTRQLGTFVGFTGNNDTSGPDGVTSHGRWLYAGDGNSTLKVFDLNSKSNTFVASIPTGGTKRVDEMALTTDGKLLLAANNADAPAFATLFKANGDSPTNTTAIMARIDVDPAILGPGSIEQPAWDPKTARFYVSIPQILGNPTGCTADGSGGHPFCQGGLLIVDPSAIHGNTTIGKFDPSTNTGVFPLQDCGPNGASVGPHDNIILGCTPGNVPTNTTTQVINAKTKNFVEVGNITGSDEVWFNSGDGRYYTGSRQNPPPTGPVMGVINAQTNFLIETIPASSNSHSVAADSKRNLIFLPEVADGGAVSMGVCGGNSGCVAVYKHDVDKDHHGDDDDDHHHDDH